MHLVRTLSLCITAVILGVSDGKDAHWPCFHGPRRDNLSTDTGLLRTWPEGGPRLLWTTSGLGHGYSSVAVAHGRLFTAGMIDRQTYVTALDLDGKKLWQSLSGRSWQAGEGQPWAVPYAGSRGTPTVDANTIYHLSELGRLAAFDLASGQGRWHVDLLERFRAQRPEYGYSESVLIDGDMLFCCPGGSLGYMVAIDKHTGQTLWANTEVNDPVGNCSPVLAVIDGTRQLVTFSARRVIALDPNSGQLLWQYPYANSRENNIADPIVSQGLVYASTGYGGGSIALRPRRGPGGGFTVDVVWQTKLLDNHHGGVLLHDGYLYGSGHQSQGWHCIEFLTGRQMWNAPGKGSLTYADGRLYCLDEKGTMSLVEAAADGWHLLGSFKVPRGGDGLWWAHPVVCGGRLYIRHGDRIMAYDLEAR